MIYVGISIKWLLNRAKYELNPWFFRGKFDFTQDQWQEFTIYFFNIPPHNRTVVGGSVEKKNLSPFE